MNKSLRLLYLANGFFVFAASLLGPLYAIFVEQIEASVLSVSFSWAAFLISVVIFSVLTSRFGDRVKEKEYLLIAGFLIRAVVWCLYIFVATLPQLILVQILIGFGEAVGTPAYNAIAAEHLDPEKHISNYSTWTIINKLAAAAATLIGGFVVSTFGFNPLFIGMSVLAVTSAFIVAILPRDVL